MQKATDIALNPSVSAQQNTLPARTFVSIAMPVLNEEAFIRAAIESILPDPRCLDYEILVLDGGSTDNTTKIVREMARTNPRIKLHKNKDRIQSAALNLAAKLADPSGRIIIRADCHAVYPERFAEICLAKLEEAGVQSVVVTMDTTGETCFQRGVAAAQNSFLGNGGAPHRCRTTSGFVDHGHHAAFDRAFFQSVGGYDERIATNEDFDLDTRIARAGGRIWLESSIPVRYFPRNTFGGLVRQYLGYGKGRAFTYLRHRYRLKLRQLAPVAVVGALSVAALLALFVDERFAAVPVAYAAACLGWGLVRAMMLRDRCVAFMGVAAMVMHNAWGIGFLDEFLRSLLGPTQASRSFASQQVRD